MNARVPAEVFPPGEFLREELEAREARVLALEARLGLKPPAPDSNDPDKA